LTHLCREETEVPVLNRLGCSWATVDNAGRDTVECMAWRVSTEALCKRLTQLSSPELDKYITSPKIWGSIGAMSFSTPEFLKLARELFITTDSAELRLACLASCLNVQLRLYFIKTMDVIMTLLDEPIRIAACEAFMAPFDTNQAKLDFGGLQLTEPDTFASFDEPLPKVLDKEAKRRNLTNNLATMYNFIAKKVGGAKLTEWLEARL